MESLIFTIDKLQLLSSTINLGVPQIPAYIAAALLSLVLGHLLPWLYDSYGIRNIPGPFLAKFSDIWLGFTAKNGHRAEIIHQLHLKYGPMVRIAPNQISISDPEAQNVVYGHGSGTLKSPFYDAFVSILPSTLTTRDRAEHARKRKIVSHIFSKKSVLEFEPHLHSNINTLIEQWDRLYDAALKGGSGPEGEGWHGQGGYLWIDLVPWMNYLSFDIIGDLAFGAPFGMTTAASDVVQIPKDQTGVYDAYGNKETKVDVTEVSAVKLIISSEEYVATMACLPSYWRPILRHFPWFRSGEADVERAAGITIIAIMKRLNSPPVERVDLLSKLQEGKDSDGNPLSKKELTAEATTFMVAGSDTISNSSSAIIYHLARNPEVKHKLQAHIDENFGGDDVAVMTAAQVKDLPYLDACINEGLRIFTTVAAGPPRVVPKGGLYISGRFFSEGTIVSVPTYTAHLDKEVWGEDVEEYRPERWEDRDQKEIQNSFIPFSIGPRTCIGRNLAMLELQLIIATLLRRYDIVLADPNQPLETFEGSLLKPLGCKVGIKRRDAC